MKRRFNSIMISLAIVTALCAEMTPWVSRYALAGEPATAVTEEKVVPCVALDSSTIRSSSNTGNADDPARPDFLLSPQEEKDLAQSMARINTWLAQHSSETTIDEPIKSGALTLVTPYQYSIAMPARVQSPTTKSWCGIVSTQMLSDYDWGFTGATSVHSQQFIATNQGNVLPNGPGTTSSAIVTYLNAYKNASNPAKTWTYARKLEADATDLFNITDINVQMDHGVIMSVWTYASGKDAWGEQYGLVGWNLAGAGAHFVAGYGVSLGSDNRHHIMYIDPWETSWDGGPPSQGRHTIDAANMAYLISQNNGGGYLVF